ncbi:MAG: DUF4870 domain-containing protein [bacterium]
MAKTKETKNKDVEDNRVLAAISYVFILCLIPLLGKKDSDYVQFHAKQGLVLVIGWFVIWVILIIPVLGWLVNFFGTIILIILSIMGIVNALAGKKWVMPFLGKYADKIKL